MLGDSKRRKGVIVLKELEVLWVESQGNGGQWTRVTKWFY